MPKQPVPQLTPRQRDVLKAYLAGESTHATAARWKVKPATVRFYRDQARLRLNGAANMGLAISRAIKYGLITTKVNK